MQDDRGYMALRLYNMNFNYMWSISGASVEHQWSISGASVEHHNYLLEYKYLIIELYKTHKYNKNI